MNLFRILRFTSVIAYLCIWLNGFIVGAPFILFLLGSITIESEPLEKVASIAGLLGLALLVLQRITYLKRLVWIDILAFALMILPILERVTTIPIKEFNYPAFIVPCFVFLIMYPLSTFILRVKQGKPEPHTT